MNDQLLENASIVFADVERIQYDRNNTYQVAGAWNTTIEPMLRNLLNDVLNMYRTAESLFPYEKDKLLGTIGDILHACEKKQEEFSKASRDSCWYLKQLPVQMFLSRLYRSWSAGHKNIRSNDDV